MKPGPRHLRAKPDPGHPVRSSHGHPSGEARQCTPASVKLSMLNFYYLLVLLIILVSHLYGIRYYYYSVKSPYLVPPMIEYAFNIGT